MNMLELLNPADDHVPLGAPGVLVVETQGDDTSAARSLMMLGTNDESHDHKIPPTPGASYHQSDVRSPVLLPAQTLGFHMSPLATKTAAPASGWPATMPAYDAMKDMAPLQPPPPPLRRRLSSISSMLNELELPSSCETSSPPASTTPLLLPEYCSVTGCLRRPSQQNQGKCAVHKGMKLCQIEGCFRPVQSRGCCKSHGGGARCKYPECTKGAISKGRCRTHGGGTRCAVPDCLKWAQRFGCCVRHSKTVTPKPQLL